MTHRATATSKAVLALSTKISTSGYTAYTSTTLLVVVPIVEQLSCRLDRQGNLRVATGLLGRASRAEYACAGMCLGSPEGLAAAPKPASARRWSPEARRRKSPSSRVHAVHSRLAPEPPEHRVASVHSVYPLHEPRLAPGRSRPDTTGVNEVSKSRQVRGLLLGRSGWRHVDESYLRGELVGRDALPSSE